MDAGGTIATMFIIPALPAFVDRYPEIQLDFGVSDRMVDLVGENVDCVIRAGSLTEQEQSLVARHIGDLPWVTCATPKYLKRYGTPTHPSDLDSGHVIAAHVSARTGRVLPLVFDLSAARAGLGIAQMPAFEMKQAALGELRAVLAAWQPAPIPMHVLYPANRHLSAKVRVFVDWIAALFREGGLGRR